MRFFLCFGHSLNLMSNQPWSSYSQPQSSLTFWGFSSVFTIIHAHPNIFNRLSSFNNVKFSYFANKDVGFSSQFQLWIQLSLKPDSL